MTTTRSVKFRTPEVGQTLGVVGDIYRFLATGDDTSAGESKVSSYVIAPASRQLPPVVKSRLRKQCVRKRKLAFRRRIGGAANLLLVGFSPSEIFRRSPATQRRDDQACWVSCAIRNVPVKRSLEMSPG